ncbi:MAG: hypothetical protein DRP08_03975, partial [Candidatus Aenigmatarchaeota archaeon]
MTPKVSLKDIKLPTKTHKIPVKAVVVFTEEFESSEVTSWIGLSGKPEKGTLNIKIGKSSVKL